MHEASWADCSLADVVLRPTQPSDRPGSVNEDQLWLKRQKDAEAGDVDVARG